MNFCSEIAAAIGRHIRNDGANPTPIPGVTLYTRSEPLHRTPGIYQPSICIVAQGCKRMHYGEYSHSYGRDRYLINSLTMPAEAEITDVSPERPFLGLSLHQARVLLLGGSPASVASYRVGYSSPSQFSREFKRFFGDLPSQVHSNHAVAS